MRPTDRWRALLPALKPVGAYLLWNMAAMSGMAVLLVLDQPVLAIAFGALLFGWFLRGYVLRPGRPGEGRRWATLRFRPLAPGVAGATLAAVPVLFALSWGVGEVWTRLVPVPPDTFRPFDALTGTPEGRLAVILFAVVAAPLLEEFVFRGMVQRPLERRLGPVPALAFTSLVFALVHALPWVLPLHLLLGLAFGYVVYATRSIWAGVLLHAANNALAALAVGTEAPELPQTVWRTGVTADFWQGAAVLAVGVVLARGVAGWLWRAGRPARLAERREAAFS